MRRLAIVLLWASVALPEARGGHFSGHRVATEVATPESRTRPGFALALVRGTQDDDYVAIRRGMVDALEKPGLPAAEKARIHARLARFYEDSVGSTQLAAAQWRAVLELDLPADHSAAADARKQLARLASYEERYAEANAILSAARRKADDPRAIEARLAGLRSVIQRQPDYPLMAKVHHYMGVNHMWRKEYGPAAGAFGEALALKPAIDLAEPTSTFRQMALFEWMHEIVPPISWSAVAAVGVVWAAAFLGLRRWRRLRWRHLVVGLILVATWCGFFFAAVVLLGDENYAKPVDAFMTPIDAHRSIFQSGRQHLMPFFWYGLAAVVGAAVFTTVSSGIRRGWLRFTANAVVSLVLSVSLMALAYVTHVSRNSVYLRSGEGAGSYVRSTFYFHVKTIERPPPGEEADRGEEGH